MAENAARFAVPPPPPTLQPPSVYLNHALSEWHPAIHTAVAPINTAAAPTYTATASINTASAPIRPCCNCIHLENGLVQPLFQTPHVTATTTNCHHDHIRHSNLAPCCKRLKARHSSHAENRRDTKPASKSRPSTRRSTRNAPTSCHIASPPLCHRTQHTHGSSMHHTLKLLCNHIPSVNSITHERAD